MENIKVIDEHNIDRVGIKLFSMDVDGTNYVVYSISRDDENDNIFVSKLLNNINNTYSMINIDDAMEKDNISLLVKDLIKYAIEMEDNKLNNKIVSLPTGKSITITVNVIDSKQQNINVSKTYISTVKKAVSKVVHDFYDINIKTEDNIFNDVEVFPVFDNNINDNKQQDTSQKVVVNNISEIDNKGFNSLDNNTNMNNITSINSNDLNIENSENNFNYTANNNNFNLNHFNNQELNNDSLNNNSNNLNNTLGNNNINENNVVENIPFIQMDNQKINTEPLFSRSNIENSVDNVVNTNLPNNNIGTYQSEKNDTLVFDGSMESNFNAALGEVSKIDNINSTNLNSVREFGSENNNTVNSDKLGNQNLNSNVNNVITGGFVNNKLLGIICIVIFLGVCSFLAYEIFNYLQVIKK